MNKKIWTLVIVIVAALIGYFTGTNQHQSVSSVEQKNQQSAVTDDVKEAHQSSAKDYAEASGGASKNQPSYSQNTDIHNAFVNRQSNIQVKGEGTVKAILKDDNEGSRHQKFILNVGNDQTVLVAHNIDLAARLDGLRKGDTVQFYGEYEYSDKGGVLHWTHKDPQGRHKDGWLKFAGRVYQ
ncbi:MAG: DUF3465 domain-containing protein [Acinetobacter sp.]